MKSSEYDARKGLQNSAPSGWTPRPQVAHPDGPMAFIMRVITLIILAFHFGMMYAGSL